MPPPPEVERAPPARLGGDVVRRSTPAAFASAAELRLARPDRHEKRAVLVESSGFYDCEADVEQFFE